MSLPPELTDHIIAFLHDDRETLKACSLVCKNWLPSSRYSLFGHLVLHDWTLQSFIKLLNSPVCTIPNRVHTLHIAWSDTGFFDTIAPYLDRFTVRSLRLVGDRWDPVRRELEGDVLMWFSRIRELDLGLAFSSPDHYFGLIASFPSLETLFLHFPCLTFRLDDFQHIHSFIFPPHLHTLVIGLAFWRPLLSWLVSIAQFPAISIVKLYCISDAELRGVQTLLQTLGPSIHSLDLDFWFSDEINRFIELTHNPNLHSLHLHIWLSCEASRASTIIPRVLSRVTSHLTEIELEVIPLYENVYRISIDWGQVGQVLVQHQFTSLRMVRIVIRTPTSFDARYKQGWVDEVRAGLSGLDDRCVLDVVLDDKSWWD